MDRAFKPEEALESLQRATVYDLASGWWPAMPVGKAHAAFNVLTYRTPRGLHNKPDLDEVLPENNSIGYGWFSELVMGSVHSGTHIDALCHITCGDDDSWHGGHSANDSLGDFGALRDDASELEPIVAHGVLLDIPGLDGDRRLPGGHEIDSDQLRRACEEQEVAVEAGDVVLVRTGLMRDWPDEAAMAGSEGAGVSLDGAEWLAAKKPLAVGADTGCFESQPSNLPGDPQPVHVCLIREHGIPIIEWINCEELARERVYSFLLICLPLTISGASGSLIRPIALA